MSGESAGYVVLVLLMWAPVVWYFITEVIGLWRER
jgi:hypothetical protein